MENSGHYPIKEPSPLFFYLTNHPSEATNSSKAHRINWREKFRAKTRVVATEDF